MMSARRIASRYIFGHIDWVLFAAALSISLLGLVTMRPFANAADAFFDRQLFWIAIAVGVFFLTSIPSYGFLRRTPVIVALYAATIALLSALFVFGVIVKGAQNRFDLGFFAVQPADPAKLALILLLAKYFARRHIVIKHIRHVLVSGGYAFLICLLVFLQPDFGGAIIIASIWLGMVLVAGISWKHLAALLLVGAFLSGALWNFGLEPFQKERVLTFLHPLADIYGTGYNAYQSTVAVGSGLLTGKGIGYGTQSKLRFLPEYQTDFIFAAYAEEWGFVGVILLFSLYGVVILRIVRIAAASTDNFVTLFALGVAIMLMSNFIVHVGINLGLLPVTGTTVPFMSYGGSHLLTEFAALGILVGMRRHSRLGFAAKDQTEFVGAM